MIPIGELRIGNYLNGTYTGFSKDVIVYDFDRESIQHTDEMQLCLPHNSFKPIELTEEWFKKAGFGIINHIDGYSFWSLMRKGNSGIPSITIYKKYTVIGNNSHVKHCEYVHQLQNLFYCLTGKELTIK